jgi:hypothetical protein
VQTALKKLIVFNGFANEENVFPKVGHSPVLFFFWGGRCLFPHYNSRNVWLTSTQETAGQCGSSSLLLGWTSTWTRKKWSTTEQPLGYTKSGQQHSQNRSCMNRCLKNIEPPKSTYQAVASFRFP